LAPTVYQQPNIAAEIGMQLLRTYPRKLSTDKESHCSNVPNIQHPNRYPWQQSSHLRKNHGKESACSNISLDPVGRFNRRCHIFGDYGGEVALYARQNAHARNRFASLHRGEINLPEST
jgi:hypothetical protein